MAADDRIRASDADREVVVTTLREAYAAGRLDLEEFDERTSAAYASKTWGELRGLTADLPEQPVLGSDLPGFRQPEPAYAPHPEQPEWQSLPGPVRRYPRRHPAAMLIPIALLIALTWQSPLSPVLVLAAIVLSVAISASRRR